ncbi:MAG: hypothetical protein JNK82_28365 [Myxococcaceae bacterium]|nr:hypothetical protein [Myxococcaceae bacterium]
MATDKQPEDEDAYKFSVKMTSEPMILISAACIFLFVVVIFEWEAVLDLFVGVFGGN